MLFEAGCCQPKSSPTWNSVAEEFATTSAKKTVKKDPMKEAMLLYVVRLIHLHALLRRRLGQGTMEMELKSGLKKEKSTYICDGYVGRREGFGVRFEIVGNLWDTWRSLGDCVPFGG